MVFPQTPRDIDVELFVNGAWTNITSDVYQRDPIKITRGKTDESSRTAPSGLQLTLNNRLGKYSPRNPNGTYYGTLGRNTPIRVAVNSAYRFWGEVSAWPNQWDVSGNDAYVPIEAAGILRRIGQGTRPVTTGLHDLLLSTTRASYWPLTDQEGAASGANAGSQTGLFKTDHLGATGSVSFGAGDLGRYLSAALNIVRTGATEATDYLYGQCFTASAQTILTYEFVYKATTLGPMKFKAEVYNAGIYSHWIVYLRGDGTNDDVQLILVEDVYFAATTTNLADTGVRPEITDGEVHHVRLTLTQNGSATDYSVHLDGTSIISGSRASFTIGSLSNVFVTYIPNAGDSAVALGYVAVWTGSNAPSVTDTANAALSYVGEKAGRRIERLCDVADIPFVSVGDLDDTLAMGAQFEDYFENQLTEIEATDRGMIYEPRTSLAIGYRTRTSLYNQAAAATADYSENEVAPPFESIDDDQGIRNDVFAQRRDGSSYQATETTGPLSVSEPPTGIGRYKDEVQVNVETDAMLPEIAGWLLHLGTVDEARFPRLTFDLANPNVVANATLAAGLLAVDIGSRIVVTDASAAGIYDEISLLVLGYSETLNAFEHTLTFNCTPASPYEVLEVDDADSKISSGEDSTLNEAMTTTETDMDVASTGFLWTTDAGEMPIPIIVGGEEMTVTAISGASSPQTFTVTRSVNGVVKTHSIGAVVRLKRPATVAL